MRKDISKENKHNQSKVKRRPSGLGAPLSWNPAHSIFTSVCVIYLFIYASSQPADYMLCLFMLNGFLPDLSSVLDTDHILPVGCKDGKKKSSQPLVSVRLPPTSQSLIKTNIMNINNNNNNNNNNKIKIGKKKWKDKTKPGIGRLNWNQLDHWVD